MSFALGIGIVTYNRRETVSDTIDRVREFTRLPDTAFVVADDGSNDGTLELLRQKQVPVITGINMGIAWNKNRALFLLCQALGCETVVLLEDDTQPAGLGWETPWIRAAQRWGHVNFAAPWMREHVLSGAGTADDPMRAKAVTAQCAAYSRNALTYGGYFDSRFRGYGHEHVEHTRRLIRVGYGGTDEIIDGEERVRYFLIESHLKLIQSKSYLNSAEEERNLQLARTIMGQQGYRSPWGEDREMRQFRSETESALSSGTERFRLTSGGNPVGRQVRVGLFGRLLGQG